MIFSKTYNLFINNIENSIFKHSKDLYWLDEKGNTLVFCNYTGVFKLTLQGKLIVFPKLNVSNFLNELTSVSYYGKYVLKAVING